MFAILIGFAHSANSPLVKIGVSYFEDFLKDEDSCSFVPKKLYGTSKNYTQSVYPQNKIPSKMPKITRSAPDSTLTFNSFKPNSPNTCIRRFCLTNKMQPATSSCI